ncbi:MAG: dolichyl-phosphate-mannose--protein mannosyltransferase [Chroococcales cyanobacterium]
MNLPAKKLIFSKLPWFSLGMAGIFIFSALLRFWKLGQFNTLVFDEVYYPKFANNYLTGTSFFNAHPPLSQYIIAIGMWIGSHLPIGQENINGFTGSLRSTFSYRWLNALTGSFLPLMIGGIAYQLTFRRSYALIAALFAAMDGLFLVESRYGLNNIYLVGFGLLGQLFLLLALNRSRTKRSPQLILSGIFLGASAAIKWNGLGFLLGIYLLWAIAWLFRFLCSTKLTPKTPLQKLSQLNLLHLISYLGIIPLLTYSLSWIPHLIMIPKPSFWEMQQQILTFHQNVGSGPDIHPYCSRWYSWIFMARPVAYFYAVAQNTHERVPQYPPLPPGVANVIYDVHAMGNPILWWLSSAAIFLLLLFLILSLIKESIRQFSTRSENWIALYFVVNYAANLLPWIKVSRCTFIYHYMGASVFAGLALAWMIDRWLHSSQYFQRQLGITLIAAIVIAFVFWLPLYLGFPLSPEGFQLRMWFKSWI